MGSSIAQTLPDDHRSLRCWANDSSAVEGERTIGDSTGLL